MSYVEALNQAKKAIENAINSINNDTNSILVSELKHIESVIQSYIDSVN